MKNRLWLLLMCYIVGFWLGALAVLFTMYVIGRGTKGGMVKTGTLVYYDTSGKAVDSTVYYNAVKDTSIQKK